MLLKSALPSIVAMAGLLAAAKPTTAKRSTQRGLRALNENAIDFGAAAVDGSMSVAGINGGEWQGGLGASWNGGSAKSAKSGGGSAEDDGDAWTGDGGSAKSSKDDGSAGEWSGSAKSAKDSGGDWGEWSGSAKSAKVDGSAKSSKSGEPKSMSMELKSRKNEHIAEVRQVGVHVRMQGIDDSPEHVWSLGPVDVNAYCEPPKGVQGPRGTDIKLEMTITAPDDEDLYIIGASCPGSKGCYLTTDNIDNRHKLFAGQEKSFWLLSDEHQAYEQRSGGGALYLMKRNGDYYYIGWNQQEFVGLHEDDLEIRDFLEDGDETKTDCLMMGVFEYYTGKGIHSKSNKSGYRVLH